MYTYLSVYSHMLINVTFLKIMRYSLSDKKLSIRYNQLREQKHKIHLSKLTFSFSKCLSNHWLKLHKYVCLCIHINVDEIKTWPRNLFSFQVYWDKI